MQEQTQRLRDEIAGYSEPGDFVPVLSLDEVERYVSQPQGLDYADRMCPPGHEGHRLWVNDFGTVYCLSCVNTGITVGSIADERDAFCQRCDHPNTWHLDGRCLGDCPCK